MAERTVEMAKPGIFQNAIVLVDGTESSMAAARFAIDMASRTGCRLTAISAVDTDILNQLLRTRIFVEEEREDYEQELELDAGKFLRYVNELAKKQKVKVESVVLKGSPHGTILGEAKRRQADLIILGHWRTSVAKRDILARERQLILDAAECSVLVVRG